MGGASLPRMRRHCRSHSTWSHEFIHALCDSSHLSSFVVRSLRCLLAYLCDGSPFADWGAAPTPQTPPKRSRPSSGTVTRSEQTPEVEDHNLPQSLDALLALVRSEAERASGQQAPATQGNNSAAHGALQPPAANSQHGQCPPPPPPPPPPPTHTHTHTQIQQGQSMRTQTSTQGTW